MYRSMVLVLLRAEASRRDQITLSESRDLQRAEGFEIKAVVRGKCTRRQGPRVVRLAVKVDAEASLAGRDRLNEG